MGPGKKRGDSEGWLEARRPADYNGGNAI